MHSICRHELLEQLEGIGLCFPPRKFRQSDGITQRCKGSVRLGSRSIRVLRPWAWGGEQWLGWAPYRGVRCWRVTPTEQGGKEERLAPSVPAQSHTGGECALEGGSHVHSAEAWIGDLGFLFSQSDILSLGHCPAHLLPNRVLRLPQGSHSCWGWGSWWG